MMHGLSTWILISGIFVPNQGQARLLDSTKIPLG